MFCDIVLHEEFVVCHTGIDIRRRAGSEGLEGLLGVCETTP